MGRDGQEFSANLSPAAFAGVAEDYARYRPPYPHALLEDLLRRSPARAMLLDLACGPGRVALQCAPLFEEVWALDSEPEMLAVGQALATERGISNISWLVGRAEELEAPGSSFDLITIGEAFHRLDQSVVLKCALRWLRPDGWLAVLGSDGILQGTQPWQRRVGELARDWTRDVFPDGWATGRPGAAVGPGAQAQAMHEAGFCEVSSQTFRLPWEWTVENVLGYLRSTSVCSPAVLGDRHPAFEAAVKSALLELHPDGAFPETLEFGYTVGRRGAD